MIHWSEPVKAQPSRQPWFDIYLTVRITPGHQQWRCTMTPYAADGTSGLSSRTAWRPVEAEPIDYNPIAFLNGAIGEAEYELRASEQIASNGNGAR